MSAERDLDCDLSGPAKPRRPDRAVYVPRALRSTDNHDARKRSGHATEPSDKCPKSPTPPNSHARDKSQPGTPRRSLDKNFCNVYTPPHLRSQPPSDPTESVPSGCPQVPNSDSAIPLDNSSVIDTSVGESFYIGDYFTKGQLGFYNPEVFYSEDSRFNDEFGYETNSPERINAADEMADHPDIIADTYSLNYGNSKDEDVDRNELRRASEEINRSSKRIIKQTFHSDVLVISDPVEEPVLSKPEPPVLEAEKQEEIKPKLKLEAKVSLKREENDWDAVFDDSGECLDPSLLEELTATVGRVHVTKARNDYAQYQTKGQALCSGPCDETFAHVVEVYDFPSEFKTNDLLSVFSEFKDTGFEIKWVDDTHALIVFSSAKIAADVLSCDRPLVRCRPLHAATLESRNKAKKCAEFLQPYRQRPETCTALARRLVSGALGVRLSTARQERDEERRLITIARERKRQAALHKEAAWEGSLTSHHPAQNA